MGQREYFNILFLDNSLSKTLQFLYSVLLVNTFFWASNTFLLITTSQTTLNSILQAAMNNKDKRVGVGVGVRIERDNNTCNFTNGCTCQLLYHLPPSGQPGRLPFLYHLQSEPKPFQHNHVATWGTYQAASNKTVINYIMTH